MRKVVGMNIRRIVRSSLLVAAAVLLVPQSVFAIDETFYSGNDILFYNPDGTCTNSNSPSPTTSVTSSGAEVEVTLAHANIQSPTAGSYAKNQRERFVGTMEKFRVHKPDFVTLNEIRPDTNTNYEQYKSFKADYPEAKSTEDSALRIVWNSADWKKIDGGIKQIHKFQAMDASKKDRYALWAVFQNIENGGVVSVIATHFNTRATFPPNLERAKTQSQNLKELAEQLLPNGSLVISGDLNYRIGDQYLNKPYSPDTILGEAGLKPVFKPADASNVDWMFHSEQLKNTSKKVYSTDRSLSDHPYLVGAFGGSSAASGDAAAVSVDSNSCVCESGVVSVGLVGKDNLEKIYNYMTNKGLSPVQAAGVIGNISQESGGDPTIVQGGEAVNTNDDLPVDEWTFDEKHTKDPSKISSGWGLIQWTPGSKVLGIAEQASATGDIYRLGTQLDILWWHMEKTSPTGVNNMLEGYRGIGDVEEATRYFEDKVEGAGDPRMADRIAAAQLALQEFGGGASTSSAGSTIETIADCDSAGDGAAAGNAVQTALNYAWPTYHEPNYLNMRPSYAAAISKAQGEGKYVGGGPHPGVDCGGFVTRVMQDSGLDPAYGGGGNTTTQLAYLSSSPKYKELKNPTSGDLTPGAIAIKTAGGGHTYMYVGKQPGFETQIASASYSPSGTAWRAPMAGMEAPADPEYRWFVLK
ncbi:MAG TPA: phage tail tip lysozyme [Candidatus Saccharibacteria bacterium]|mgnify:CR=1 FL=1|nr:phage tail tip lysozyme [Candidatus Saccharibacteria bacterium]HRK93997.1 phage tail tip lysozyme [Candidatus Saccharibacteria bacterium]